MKKILLFTSMLSTICSLSLSSVSCNLRMNDDYRDVNTSLDESAVQSDWYPLLDTATNLTLLKGRQLIVSGIDNDEELDGVCGKSAATPISDVNLDFSSHTTIPDGCTTFSTNMVYFNNLLYSDQRCNSWALQTTQIGEEDENGNYWPTDYHKYTNYIYSTIVPNISNDNIYIKNQWNHFYNVSDLDNVFSVGSLSENFTEYPNVKNLNCIYNIEDELLIGTNDGLYISPDGDENNYSLVPGSESLNITSITSNNDHSKLFFGTSGSGIWFSDFKNMHLMQLNYLKDKTINENTFFMSQNDYLYFGVKNEGLYYLNSKKRHHRVYQIKGSNLSDDDNIRSIVETSDQKMIVLTNNNIVIFDQS